MKKTAILFLCIILFCVAGCSSKEIKLECEEVTDIATINCDAYIFVYKTDCKYCHKDYAYVNNYNSYQNKEINIYSYNLDNGQLDIEIESVPCLLLLKNSELTIEVKGYIQIKRYLNSLID